eukprot:4810090-Alexandrium_andersonii.AAC.1
MNSNVSGYAGSQEIIDHRTLRITDDPEQEEEFQEWCRAQRVLFKQQKAKELQAQARIVESGGQANRALAKTSSPRAPRGPGEAGQGMPNAERLNLLLETPIPDTGGLAGYARDWPPR